MLRSSCALPASLARHRAGRYYINRRRLPAVPADESDSLYCGGDAKACAGISLQFTVLTPGMSIANVTAHGSGELIG